MKMIFSAEGFVHTDNPEHYVSENSFLIDKDLSSLKFEFFGGGKELFFHIKDSSGALRVQHQSSSEPSRVFLCEDEKKTGVGTCPGKISKGTWFIKVFTYAPRFNRMWGKVSFEVKIFEGVEDSENQLNNYVSWVDSDELEKGRVLLKEFEPDNLKIVNKKWLSGDFHAHTVLTDGSASPSELLDEGLSKKLDFFFITEHNTLTTGFAKKDGIVVFPSFEVTTAIGHFNLPGLRSIPDWILSKGPAPAWKDIKKLIENSRGNGVLLSINHPFMVPWHWQYNDLPLSLIDSIEIITDPYDKNLGDTNEKAFALIDILWNNGYRITGIGGSDTHTKYSDSQLAEPVTKIFAKPGSLSSVLESIKNHSVEIFLDLECDFNYTSDGKIILPGTDIGNFDDLDLEFSLALKNGAEQIVLKVIENGILVEEKNVFPGERFLVKRVWKGNSDWIRCELRDNKNQIRGYINPLHRGRKEGSLKVWGDALELLEK